MDKTTYNKGIINNKKKNIPPSITCLQKTLSFFTPPDPLKPRQLFRWATPNHCTSLEFIEYPKFNSQNDKYDQHIPYTFEYTPKPRKEKHEFSCQEKLWELHINSIKMKKWLIYSKFPVDKSQKYTTENIVDLTKYQKNDNKRKGKHVIPFNEGIETNPEISNCLRFESKFECGNLSLAYYLQDNVYELYLNNDTNTKGYTQWFFFKVTNTKKGERANFNICNLYKPYSQYRKGLKIWMFSNKSRSNQGKSWFHTTESVSYQPNLLYKYQKKKKIYFYTLSFGFTFPYDDDEVYFANSIPYSYTELMEEMNEYQKHENVEYPYFQRKTLCQTLGGNNWDYITINNSNLSNFSNESRLKNGVVLFARQHPSESVSSWAMKGAIDFLMGKSDEAEYWRQNYIFKIIPMLNPDGVISGNTRTSFAGCDLNRRWETPNPVTHPEIFNAKEMIEKFSKQRNIDLILDFHGHFGAFNSFFYGNHNDKIEEWKLFPYFCAGISDIINWQRSVFRIQKQRKTCARISWFNIIPIDNIITWETSYFGCITPKHNSVYFTTDMLMQIGRDVCMAWLWYNYNSKMKRQIHWNGWNESYVKRVNDWNTEYRRYLDSEKNVSNKPVLSSAKIGKGDDKIIENEELDEEDLDEENMDSDSDPSCDELDPEEIKRLLPIKIKKKKKKKSKISQKLRPLHLSLAKKNNNNNETQNIPIEQSTPLPKLNSLALKHRKKSSVLNNWSMQSQSPVATGKTNQQKLNETSIMSSDSKQGKIAPGGNNTVIININCTQANNSKIQIKLNNWVNSECQTESIFFEMHWSYFIGSYKIISSTIKTKLNQSFNALNDKKIMNSFYYIKKLEGKTQIQSDRNSNTGIVNNIKSLINPIFAATNSNFMNGFYTPLRGNKHNSQEWENWNKNPNCNSLMNGSLMIRKKRKFRTSDHSIFWIVIRGSIKTDELGLRAVLWTQSPKKRVVAGSLKSRIE